MHIADMRRLDRPLSARELEVLALLYTPLSPREIATELGIKYETVKRHVWFVLQKTGSDSRLHLLAKKIKELEDETLALDHAEVGG